MLAPSTLVTITVSGQSIGVQTKDDVLAGVIASLGSWGVSVPVSTIDAGSIIGNVITFQWFHFQYRATLTVSTPGDTFEDADAVAAAVADAFETVAGSRPTGVQSQIVRSAPAISAPSAGSSLLPDLGSFGAALQGDVHLLIFAILAVVLILVYGLGWGKNVGAIAGSFRL